MNIIASLLPIAIVLLIAYIQAGRGFFSSLINLVAVIIGGAIAFALWEVLAQLLIGTNRNWIINLAWGFSLATIFATAVAILRFVLDRVIRGNVEPGGTANFVGGGLCGAAAGVITAGVAMISISYVGANPGFPFGYNAIVIDENGAVVRNDKLLLPVDRITSRFYGVMSQTAFRPEIGTPIAEINPDFEIAGHASRLVRSNDYSHRAFGTDRQFTVKARYTVGKENASLASQDLLIDSARRTRPQTVHDLDGNPIGPDYYLEGVVITFDPSAREQNGRVVIGAPSVRLTYVDRNGDPRSAFPIAIISQAQAADPRVGRWRLDARNVFIASVGGVSEFTSAFEFAIPRGSTVTGLYVRNIRAELPETVTDGFAFPDIAQRDQFITNRRIIQDFQQERIGPSTNPEEVARLEEDRIVMINNRFPERLNVNKGLRQGLILNDDNRVTGGEGRFRPGDVTGFLDRNIRVDQFYKADDVGLVQVVVDARNRDWGLLSRRAGSLNPNAAPVLVDNRQQVYQPVGFIYRDRNEVHIRYTIDRPIASLSELPVLSTNDPSQVLILLYTVSSGLEIREFRVGDERLRRFTPAIKVN